MSELSERSELARQAESDNNPERRPHGNWSKALKVVGLELPTRHTVTTEQLGSIPIETAKLNSDSPCHLKKSEVLDICALNKSLHRRQVNRNLMSIGLLEDEGDDSGTFGSEIETRLSTHYGINILADEFKGAKELANLVFNCEPKEFPAKFNAWIENFLRGIEFIKPKEIRNSAKILTKAGFYILESYRRNENSGKLYGYSSSIDDVVERNGFVDSQVWTLFVAKGKIPAGDPHDLISHAAGFIEPVFREEMKKSGKINFFVSTLHRSLAEEFGPGNNTFLKIHELGEQLRILTTHTFENMSYLTRSDPPKLVLQGNGGYNFASYVSRAYLEHDRTTRLVDILKMITRGGHFQLDALENVKQFEEQNPQLAANFYRAQAKMSVDTEEGHKQLICKFGEIYQLLLDKHENEPEHLRFSTGIIDDLALEISKHQELNRMFDYDSRLELFKAGNNYFEAYLEWLCSGHEIKPMLEHIKSDFERLDFSNLEQSLGSAIENRKKHVDRLLVERLENQKKHEQEIISAVDKFIAENPDFAVKKDIYVKYPEQIDSNFHKVEHLGFGGMGRPPGVKSNLALLAKVVIEKDQKIQEFMGRVFREYPAGFSVIDESSGDVHVVNVNFSKLISAHLRAEQDLSWKRVYVSCDEPSEHTFDYLKKYADPYAIVKDDNGDHVYGRIAAVMLESGKQILCVADSAGNIHTLDPSQGKHGIELQLIEGDEFTRSLFVGLGSNKIIQQFKRCDLDLDSDRL